MVGSCKSRFAPAIWAVIVAWPLGAGPAWALQVHPAPEGLYAHQIAHVFFLMSMVTMIFWLRKNRLIERPGWRMIQWSCLFFILWNAGAIWGHIMDHRLAEDAFVGSGWSRRLVWDRASLPYLYIFLRMDHLTCVPAMGLLYLALRRFRREADGGPP
jgi:hypothetical protein